MQFDLERVVIPSHLQVFEHVVVLWIHQVRCVRQPFAVRKPVGPKWLHQVDWTLIVSISSAVVDLALAWNQIRPVVSLVSVYVVRHVWSQFAFVFSR